MSSRPPRGGQADSGTAGVRGYSKAAGGDWDGPSSITIKLLPWQREFLAAASATNVATCPPPSLNSARIAVSHTCFSCRRQTPSSRRISTSTRARKIASRSNLMQSRATVGNGRRLRRRGPLWSGGSCLGKSSSCAERRSALLSLFR